MQIRVVDEQHCAEFLASLYNPEFQERQETTSEVHEQPFRWIFDLQKVRPWNSLVDWSGEGDGIHWISGEAGSSKSTLMSYIIPHSCTTDTLDVWTHGLQVRSPAFFFLECWNWFAEKFLGSLEILALPDPE